MQGPHPISAEQRKYMALFGEDDLWVDPGYRIADPSQPSTPPVRPVLAAVPANGPAPMPSATPPRPMQVPAAGSGRSSTLVAPVPQRSSDALDAVRAAMGDCRLCRLCEGRQTIVFGEGNPKARVMFVGEGPGADEDASGRPFVGRAGRLLTDIIEKGMQLSRGEVYIANVVKCRPPGNRDPESDEINQCLDFLHRQIAAIRPEVIVVLGKSAARGLLNYEGPMGRIRGQWQGYRHGDLELPVMPTWHPSYLLRTPEAKRDTWEDIKLVLSKLGKAHG